MKTFHLFWEASPCGTPAETFTVYMRRGFRRRDTPDDYIHVFTPQEVVEGGVAIATEITETEIYDTRNGLDISYAVVPNAGGKSGPPRIVAANVSGEVEDLTPGDTGDTGDTGGTL